VNNGPLLFLGIFASVATSFWMLLFAPQVQIGRQQASVIELTGERYPAVRSGAASQGAEVYRSLGCVECHSQQVRQTGANFELWLAEPGTNRPVLAATLVRLNLASAVEADKLLEKAPVKLRSALGSIEARMLAAQLTNRIKTLNQRGITFLIVEHNMQFVMSLCDKVAVMHRGSLLTEGTPDQVRGNPAVLEAYLGD